MSDPVSFDYEWVVTGDASTPIFCKFSLFSDASLSRISSHCFPRNNVNDPVLSLYKESCESSGDFCQFYDTLLLFYKAMEKDDRWGKSGEESRLKNMDKVLLEGMV